MTVRERTQVGIVVPGPAGLLLSHLLALGGVDSVRAENRSRAYCEARQRAGMLESTTVELLRSVGLGDWLDVEGLEHDGIYVQFDIPNTKTLPSRRVFAATRLMPLVYLTIARVQ